MKQIGKETIMNALGASILVAAMVIAKDALEVDLTKVVDLNQVIKGIASLK